MIVRPLVVAPAGMQPHFLLGHIDERAIDGADDLLDERLEIAERLVAERAVALHGEIGRIDLQGEAGGDDRLVFDPQALGDGVEIGVDVLVVVVLDDGGEDAGRGGREERCRRAFALLGHGRLEIGDLGVEFGLALIAQRADAARQVGDIADGLAVGHHARAVFLEFRVCLDIGERQPFADAADTRQPPAQVEHEGLALLLAIGDDVDAAGALLADDPRHGLGAFGREQFFVDGFAARTGGVEARQGRWARERAGVGGENAGSGHGFKFL